MALNFNIKEENMENNSTYVAVLKSTLIRKYNVLLELEKIMERFDKILSLDDIDTDSMDKILDERQTAIKQIEDLDAGFESIYSKVEVEIKNNRVMYEKEIKQMQEYIPKITELGVTISAMETRCKAKFEIFFSKKRTQVKNFKLSSRTVANYYKNSYGGGVGVSMLDSKK